MPFKQGLGGPKLCQYGVIVWKAVLHTQRHITTTAHKESHLQPFATRSA